jgi:hypothetical protein
VSDRTRCPRCTNHPVLTIAVVHGEAGDYVQMECDQCTYTYVGPAEPEDTLQADTDAVIIDQFPKCTRCGRTKCGEFLDPLCIGCRADDAKLPAVYKQPEKTWAPASGDPPPCAQCGEVNTRYEHDSLCPRCATENAVADDDGMGAAHIRDVMVSE